MAPCNPLYVKVAVHIDGKSYLSVLNLNLPVEQIVENLCVDYCEEYVKETMGLWSDKFLSSESKFVTDDNKHSIAMGSILYLKDSPNILAKKLFLTIKHRTMTDRLLFESEDISVLSNLYNMKAHIEVYKLLESNPSDSFWFISLNFIHKLLVGRYITSVKKNIVFNLFNFIKAKFPDDVLKNKRLIIISLRVLSALRRFGQLKYVDAVFDDLAALLLHQKHTEVQESALELLTFLVLFPNDEEEGKTAAMRVVNQKIIGCICEHILRVTLQPSEAMQQQLYRYQTLVLRPYLSKMVTKLNYDSVKKLSRKLSQRARDVELPTRRRRAASFSSMEEISPSPPASTRQNLLSNIKASFRRSNSFKELVTKKEERKSVDEMKRSWTNLLCLPHKAKDDDDMSLNISGPIHHHLKDKKSPVFYVDFPEDHNGYPKISNSFRRDPDSSTESTSELTISCLSYQAEYFAEQYQKWALTRKENYDFVEQIIKVVYTVLEIERPYDLDDKGETFIPLVFFCYPYVLEELFCETCLLYDKTSKEMRASTTSDIAKVLSVIEEQLRCTIHPNLLSWEKNLNIEKPTTLEKMREILNKINYRRITEKRLSDLEDGLKLNLRNKPMYVEHREKIKPQVLELIKRQRIHFAKTGEYFLKINSKGEIQKNQKMFLKLNLKSNKLISWKCQEDPNVLSGLQCSHYKSISIEELADVSIGKESTIYRRLRHGRFLSHRSPINMAHVVPHTLHMISSTTSDSWLAKAPQNDPEHWGWLMSLKLKDDSYINLCAVSLQSAHSWIDVFHIILGKPMTSPAQDEELNEILDMEVRLHFLDIEMLPVPDIVPTVPPLPKNFDKHHSRAFC